MGGIGSGRPAKAVETIDNKVHKKSTQRTKTRKIVEEELKGSTRHLKCPEYLTAEAKKEWARIVAIDDSRAKPVIYDSDVGLLQVLCEFWAMWLIIRQDWANNPTVLFKDKDGMLVNPYIAEMRKLAKEMKVLYSAFGLTPQGRAQFGVDVAKNDGSKKDKHNLFS